MRANKVNEVDTRRVGREGVYDWEKQQPVGVLPRPKDVVAELGDSLEIIGLLVRHSYSLTEREMRTRVCDFSEINLDSFEREVSPDRTGIPHWGLHSLVPRVPNLRCLPSLGSVLLAR